MDFGGVDSRWAYTALVGLVAAERLVELAVSRRNEGRLRARGAREVGAGHYPVMVAMHAGFLVSCVAEVWWLDRPLIPVLAVVMLGVLVATTGLRYWAISTLDGRWTTRVWVLPDAPPVTGGPYRWLRHPNYLAVVVEILVLPLVHTAWLTALVFSLANAWLLTVRIRAEEAALTAAGGYEPLVAQPRFVPGRQTGEQAETRS